MKLFLSSLAVSDALVPEFSRLVGKAEKDITVAFIQNGADPYDESNRAWVDKENATMQSHAFAVETVDLRQYRGKLPELKALLAGKDIVWFGGGNVFYLRWLLQDMGLDTVLADLVNNGLVYAGCSAGAIVVGPTLKHFEVADDPGAAPQIIFDGLHLTELTPVPHMDNAKYASVINDIYMRLRVGGYQTVPLNDAQALVIDGKIWKVI